MEGDAEFFAIEHESDAEIQEPWTQVGWKEEAKIEREELEAQEEMNCI